VKIGKNGLGILGVKYQWPLLYSNVPLYYCMYSIYTKAFAPKSTTTILNYIKSSLLIKNCRCWGSNLFCPWVEGKNVCTAVEFPIMSYWKEVRIPCWLVRNILTYFHFGWTMDRGGSVCHPTTGVPLGIYQCNLFTTSSNKSVPYLLGLVQPGTMRRNWEEWSLELWFRSVL
jgi:hypothetical protein